MMDWDHQEATPLRQDNDGSTCCSAEDLAQETTAIQAEIAALESSALTFGQPVFPIPQHDNVIAATSRATPSQPPQQQDETEQEDSRITMRRQRSPESQGTGDDDDRLSAFDVLVVLPFYIVCGVMAVLALNGTFWNAASSTKTVFPWSAHGNSRRLLQHGGHLESPRPQQVVTQTDVTWEEFRLDNGIDLALLGMDDDDDLETPNSYLRGQQTTTTNDKELPPPFELYQEWDLASHVHGNERWQDLLRLHQKLLNDAPTGPFYHNRDAVQPWLTSLGISSVMTRGWIDPRQQQTLATAEDNPSYTFVIESKSDDGWIVQSTTLVGPNNEEEQQKASQSDRSLTATESAGSHDGGLEFQCLLLWGRVYAVQWSFDSHGEQGLVYRNGTAVGLDVATPLPPRIPSWVVWDHVLATAERVAAHKSLFQVDIVVLPPTMADVTVEDKKKYTVVRVDFVPGPSFGHIQQETKAARSKDAAQRRLDRRQDDMLGFWNQAARLLIAGYKISPYKTIANADMPLAYTH